MTGPLTAPEAGPPSAWPADLAASREVALRASEAGRCLFDGAFRRLAARHGLPGDLDALIALQPPSCP